MLLKWTVRPRVEVFKLPVLINYSGIGAKMLPLGFRSTVWMVYRNKDNFSLNARNDTPTIFIPFRRCIAQLNLTYTRPSPFSTCLVRHIVSRPSWKPLANAYRCCGCWSRTAVVSGRTFAARCRLFIRHWPLPSVQCPEWTGRRAGDLWICVQCKL